MHQMDWLTTYAQRTKRIVPPEESLNRIEPLFERVGITRIGDLTGLDRIGIPVAHCIRPNSRSLAVSQGKGPDLSFAKVSAAMESIELYCAEHFAPETIHASFRSLGEERAVNPRYLNLAEGTACNEDTPLEWVPGRDLVANAEVLVPYDLVHCNYVSQRGEPEVPSFSVSSNGLASGNCRAEAIVHALTEVIERDGTARADGPSAARLVRPDTIDDDLVIQLLECCRSAGVEAFLWDESTQMGVPSFGCALFDAASFGSVFTGYGCHLHPAIAVTRAITEAAQSRVTYIAGARDDLTRTRYQGLTRNVAALLEQVKAITPSVDMRTMESESSPELDSDIDVLLHRFDEYGIDRVVIVELTDPALAVPVVRAIVPGMALRADGVLSTPPRPRDRS